MKSAVDIKWQEKNGQDTKKKNELYLLCQGTKAAYCAQVV